jgi:hypothetical protein
MTKKIKTFDSFLFRGELDLLEFRLTELDSFVDRFIIAEVNSNKKDSIYLKEKERFKKWKNKISHIFVSEEDLSFLDKITVEFINHSPDFEDILMISEINQIPNLNEKNKIQDLLSCGPVVIEHQNFVWNIDYIDGNWIDGTLVFTFSSILVNKNILFLLYESKNNPKTTNQKIKNGWVFSNFEYSDEYKYQIEEKLPPTTIDPITTYPLIEHKKTIELPINYQMLKHIEISDYKPKTHLFLVESEITSTIDEYDSITIVEFSNNLNEVIGKKVSSKIMNHVLFLPNKILYSDNLEDFQNQYKLNEVKRMSNSVFLKEQDTIKIIYRDLLIK